MENYTQSIRILFFLMSLGIFACKDESKKNDPNTPNVAAQNANLESTLPTTVGVLRDSVLKTTVQKDTQKMIIASPVQSKISPKSRLQSDEKKLKADTIHAKPWVEPAKSSSIFDGDKKNADGYVPKN